jgi:hypothetical protein
VSVVTTAEEMPVNETLEICHQLSQDLGLARGWMFVNRFHFPEFSGTEIEGLAEHVGARSVARRALVTAVVDRAREEFGWSELNEAHRQRLERECGWEQAVLPTLYREEFGLADVEHLARRIEEQIERPALARAKAPRGQR